MSNMSNRDESVLTGLIRVGYHQRIVGLLLAALSGPEALRLASDRPEVEALLADGWLDSSGSVNWEKVEHELTGRRFGCVACGYQRTVEQSSPFPIGGMCEGCYDKHSDGE